MCCLYVVSGGPHVLTWSHFSPCSFSMTQSQEKVSDSEYTHTHTHTHTHTYTLPCEHFNRVCCEVIANPKIAPLSQVLHRHPSHLPHPLIQTQEWTRRHRPLLSSGRRRRPHNCEESARRDKKREREDKANSRESCEKIPPKATACLHWTIRLRRSLLLIRAQGLMRKHQ